jgi:hypothetical protein
MSNSKLEQSFLIIRHGVFGDVPSYLLLKCANLTLTISI